MINIFSIDHRSRVPIYEQIKNQIIIMIRTGIYKPHSQLPSIRTVSVEAGLNVNTVKHAFADLESDGIIYTLPGRGSFVSDNAMTNENMRKQALDELKAKVENAKIKGISFDEIIELIKKAY